MDQNTIEGLLVSLDEAISSRERNYASLDTNYKNENGHILGKEYDDYKFRKENIEKKFSEKALDYQNKIDDLCKVVRKHQPALIELTDENINERGRFPRRVALGKCHVQYENLEFYVPKMFEFPFRKPMYIYDDSQISLIHKVLLRLLYALPVDKQEYYVYDPMGLGKSVWKFNKMLSNGKVFPQKKVMTKPIELKEALKDVMEYMQSMYSGTFNLGTCCEDWDSYNRWLYSQGNSKKMLPYKVFLFMNVPDGMDAECFEMFRKLLLHSEKCGFLVLFSFNEILFEADDSKMKAQELMLKQCIENSLPLHSVLDKSIIEIDYDKLTVSSIGEKFPEDAALDTMIKDVSNVIAKSANSMFSFDDMLPDSALFNKSSINGLNIPCGYTTSGGSEVNINISDRYPHYLIGGTTGSGKSNLLHNIIVSSCWNYSPDELRMYLLDFKEGVEFSRYSSPVLRHAELVATEADIEYGISVLDHLTREKTRRYAAFKKHNCKDITAFKKVNTMEVMPRILVIIDEFQVLFESNDKERTLETLTTLAKQGRACGIHLVLATQSLKGIDFGTLEPQFSGRIALKCSAEDSKMLLGSVSQGNEEASELEIPYGILNTSQGSKAGNIKYAIPEAKDEMIGHKLEIINIQSDKERYFTETRIFEGQTFPAFPQEESFVYSDCLTITLGELASYEAKRLEIQLIERPENNILICGHDEQMKQDFIEEILASCFGNRACDEVVWIGDSDVSFSFTNLNDSKIIQYRNMEAFLAAEKEHFYDKHRVVILDNINLAKEIGFSSTTMYSMNANENGKVFKAYFEEANKQGTHFVCFYEGTNRVKASGIPLTDFKYRVGYVLNLEEKNFLLGNTVYGKKQNDKKRAFLADNMVVKEWFRPYENKAKGFEE